jgi:hypothetical protein
MNNMNDMNKADEALVCLLHQSPGEVNELSSAISDDAWASAQALRYMPDEAKKEISAHALLALAKGAAKEADSAAKALRFMADELIEKMPREGLSALARGAAKSPYSACDALCYMRQNVAQKLHDADLLALMQSSGSNSLTAGRALGGMPDYVADRFDAKEITALSQAVKDASTASRVINNMSELVFSKLDKTRFHELIELASSTPSPASKLMMYAPTFVVDQMSDNEIRALARGVAADEIGEYASEAFSYARDYIIARLNDDDLRLIAKATLKTWDVGWARRALRYLELLAEESAPENASALRRAAILREVMQS